MQVVSELFLSQKKRVNFTIHVFINYIKIKAGFKEIVSTIVDEAVWAENPYDRIPVTGDSQRFCIIQAKK